jgi:toxin CptA
VTIAVSAVVRPSRLLLGAVALMCGAIVVVAGAIAFGMVGDLAAGVRMVIAALCAAVAIFGFLQAKRAGKTFRIDISGVGQIRLSEDNGAAGVSELGDRPDQRGSGEIMQLLADSTIWPHLLCLRLQGEDRRVRTVLVLPDSLDSESYRALSVACRWIAAHNIRAEGEHV